MLPGSQMRLQKFSSDARRSVRQTSVFWHYRQGENVSAIESRRLTFERTLFGGCFHLRTLPNRRIKALIQKEFVRKAVIRSISCEHFIRTIEYITRLVSWCLLMPARYTLIQEINSLSLLFWVAVPTETNIISVKLLMTRSCKLFVSYS